VLHWSTFQLNLNTFLWDESGGYSRVVTLTLVHLSAQPEDFLWDEVGGFSDKTPQNGYLRLRAERWTSVRPWATAQIDAQLKEVTAKALELPGNISSGIQAAGGALHYLDMFRFTSAYLESTFEL